MVFDDELSVHAWSVANRSWRALPALRGLAELSHVIATDDGTLVAVGFGVPGVPTVRMLEAGRQSWATLPALPKATGWGYTGFVEAAMLDRTLVLWGYAERTSDTGKHEAIVVRADLDAGTWSELPPAAGAGRVGSLGARRSRRRDPDLADRRTRVCDHDEYFSGCAVVAGRVSSG